MLDVKDISTVLPKRQLGNRVLGMYSDLLCEKGSTANIKKFARTVTNKVGSSQSSLQRSSNEVGQWLLHLLTEDDPEVVVHGTKILARLLVVHGSGYVSKFAAKTGGFTIMRHRLRRWWDLPTLWPICFSILFGHDVAEIDFERSFELYSLLDTFSNCKVVYPGVLPVIMAMLQHGLKDVLHHQDDPDSPLTDLGNGQTVETASLSVPVGHNRRRSMSLTKELESRRKFLNYAFSLSFTNSLYRGSSTQTRKTWRAGDSPPYCDTLLRRLAFKVPRIQRICSILRIY
jgi:hypothetical protein